MLFLILAVFSCGTPGPVTGRPDPNVSTSGTLGSVKATDGPPPEVVAARVIHDTIGKHTDTTQRNRP